MKSADELREYLRLAQRKRRVKLRLKGLCTNCGKKAETGKLCNLCKDKQNKKAICRRVKWRENRQCTACGKPNDSLASSQGCHEFLFCIKCRAISSALSRACPSYEARKQINYELKAAKICTICRRRKATKEFVVCDFCRRAQCEYKARITQERKNKRMCVQCGKNPLKTKTLCSTCSRKLCDRAYARAKHRSKNKVCVKCGKTPLHTKLFCSMCAEISRLRARIWRKQKREQIT